MKNLKELLNESIFDGETNWEKITDLLEFKNKYKTLRDCLDGYVTCKSEGLGPNRYSIATYSKLITKKFKTDPIMNRNNKKCTPAILSDMMASIADQVIIDWDLPAEGRMRKALDDFLSISRSINFPEMEKYRDITKHDIEQYKEGDTVYLERYSLGGYAGEIVSKHYNKSMKSVYRKRSEVICEIWVSYGEDSKYQKKNNEWIKCDYRSRTSGEFTMSIRSESPITVDLDSFFK